MFSPNSAEADVGWGGKMNGHLMASCVMIHEYVYQKIKLDNPSSSYGIKNSVCFFMPHSVLQLIKANQFKMK